MEQKFVFTFYVCVCTHTCVQVSHNVHLEARGQLLEVHSFLHIIWIPASRKKKKEKKIQIGPDLVAGAFIHGAISMDEFFSFLLVHVYMFILLKYSISCVDNNERFP